MEEKKCSKCGSSTNGFNKNRSKRDGLDHYCRQCRKSYKYSAFSQEKKNAINEKAKLSHRRDQRIEMLAQAKRRAKKLGLHFDLTVDDIIVPTHCPALGIRLCVSEKGYGHPASPTIDRKNNDLGYVKGNISVISWRANRLKSDATLEEVFRIAQYMGSIGHRI